MTLQTVEELLEAAAGTLGSDVSWKVTISAVTTGCCCSCSALVSLTPRSSAAICDKDRKAYEERMRGVQKDKDHVCMGKKKKKKGMSEVAPKT